MAGAAHFFIRLFIRRPFREGDRDIKLNAHNPGYSQACGYAVRSWELDQVREAVSPVDGVVLAQDEAAAGKPEFSKLCRFRISDPGLVLILN